jgi:uncharacterized membrane protein
MQKAGLIALEDPAIVKWRIGKKGPETQQLNRMGAVDASDGAFWGMFFGLVFFVPFFGCRGIDRGSAGQFADVERDD